MPLVTAKWRPTLGMVTAAVIAAVLVLPLVGLVFFRLYENQLVRQTEGELIAQAAMLSAIYAREIEASGDAFPVGPEKPPSLSLDPDGRYAPIIPSLDLASSRILVPRPASAAAPAAINAGEILAGLKLQQVMRDTQVVTLAGFRLLDASGTVIGGRGDVGRSFADLEEVQTAMSGRFSSMLRLRDEDEPPPPLYSISRGTKIRVFVAMPVFVDNKLRGIVYVSRTPDNILRHLYRERDRVTLAALLMLAVAAVIGFLFVRAVTRPMRDLVGRAESISRGDRSAIGPLPHHGTRELAGLTQSFMAMAKRLSDRSDYLSTFASHVSHELKSPLTSIKGAAELVRDNESMAPEKREQFLSNILADADRMILLLERLRDLARADNPDLGGETTLAAVAERLRQDCEGVEIALEGEGETPVQMSPDNAAIIFAHLADNARRHGAKRVTLAARREGVRYFVEVRDDGAGISPGNRARVFDAFFTTRRAEGGTGMGLGIVRAMLQAHGGDIRLAESAQGAAFELRFSVETEAETPQRSFWSELKRLLGPRAGEGP